MSKYRRVTFGWSPGADGRWHSIYGMAGYGLDGSMFTGCRQTLPLAEIREEPTGDGTKCLECADEDDPFAEQAWGSPDIAFHLLTRPGVIPGRWGHYHGTARYELEPGEPQVKGDRLETVYTCECNAVITESRPWRRGVQSG